MARKLSTAMLWAIVILVLLRENMTDTAACESQSPAPQPGIIPLHGYKQGSLQPQECLPRCSLRCSATQYKKPCMFFCQKCCAKCLCVPPGTYGNKQVCPCYNDWKTKRGGPKCP